MKHTILFLNKILFGFFTLTFSLSTLAYDQKTFDQFEAGISIPSGATDEMRKFTSQGQPLSDAYIQSFLPMMKKRLFDEKRKALKELDQACHENVKVDFLKRLTETSDPVAREFESGLIRIEVSSCMKVTNPINVISIFSDLDFQKDSISTITSNEQKGNLICERTTVSTIGNSSYCYEPIISDKGSMAFNHHFNSWNAPLSEADVPVYFRELFVTAHSTSSGTAFHMVAYIRSAKLGKFKQVFAESSIKNEQSKSMQLLKNQLP